MSGGENGSSIRDTGKLGVTAGQCRRIQASFGAAFKAALLAAIEGTELEGRFLDGSEPGTDGCMPWLRHAAGDGDAGYWIACGLSANPALPSGAWPTRLRANYLCPADHDPDAEFLSERPFDLTLAGTGARDARILAAITVTVVLDHQRVLARRTSPALPLPQSRARQLRPELPGARPAPAERAK